MYRVTTVFDRPGDRRSNGVGGTEGAKLKRRLNAVILLVAMFALIGASVVMSQDGGPQPSITIPKMRHDFGKVFEMEKYEYTFLVRNTGKADLVIEDVKPG